MNLSWPRFFNTILAAAALGLFSYQTGWAQSQSVVTDPRLADQMREIENEYATEYSTSASPTDPVIEEPLDYLIEKTLATEAELLSLCQEFLDLILINEFDRAYDHVRPFFPVSRERVEILKSQTQRQMELAQLQFGISHGTKLMKAEPLQGTLFRFQFLQLFQRDYLYWEFLFYNPDGKWYLNSIGFSDNIDNLWN